MILNSFSDNWIVLGAIVCLIVDLILGILLIVDQLTNDVEEEEEVVHVT